ncbi:hypothetical protein BAY60_25495 [Prauserella muralis]|uniref:Uncharacterized protein n=1 Tax=Prauserella muralis TaxID=588067 RepID=A0A2V4AKX9_9PSEU|nr:hypothetical protein BAY60_25495 [Prauserella muralis]
MTVLISHDRAPSPGDLRQLARGDVVELAPSAPGRHDWPSLLSAITTAVARGADVVWRRS